MMIRKKKKKGGFVWGGGGGGGKWPVLGAELTTFVCTLSRISGNLNLLEP